MALLTSELETAAFESTLPQLEEEGYLVIRHPTKNVLPPFLRPFRPDAIAYKGDRKIAIEIVPGARDPQSRVERLNGLRNGLVGHPDWELRLVYAAPRQEDELLPIIPSSMIETHLDQIEASLDTLSGAAALLTAWASFEAAARRLLPAKFGRAQRSARMLELLASEGYVTPDQADALRPISRLRNEIAHGRLDLTPSREQVTELVAVTREILHMNDGSSTTSHPG